MRYRLFEPLGRPLSVLCMGTDHMGARYDRETSFAMLDAYCDLGGNFIDTARLYGLPDGGEAGLSERVLGEWMALRGNRAQLTIATKGGHPLLPEDPFHPRLDRDTLTRELDESLRALRVDYVDLFWLHRDDPQRPVGEMLETLNLFLQQKKVLAIGASNWSRARLMEADAYAHRHGLTSFCAVQPQWSLARQEAQRDPSLTYMDRDLYAWHLQNNIPCVPFSSQAKGFFNKLAAGGEQALSTMARTRFWTPHNRALFERLQALERQTGISPGAAALAFLTSQPFPVFPIAGASRVEQVRALSEAADACLTPDQLAFLMEGAQLA